MFGKLKEKAQDKALETLGEKFSFINENLEMFKKLKVSDLQNNDTYKKIIVNPLWTGFKIQAGPAIAVAQKFIDVEKKFENAILDLRDDLIIVEDEKVKLVSDFQEKLIPTLMTSLKS